MKTGLTDRELSKIEKECRELEEADARLNTAKRKAKKIVQTRSLREAAEEYSSPRITGKIKWIPTHTATKERWKGVLQGKKAFEITKWFWKYNLQISNNTLTEGKLNYLSAKSFEKAAKEAEEIVENYLKSLKKKTKNEVS